MRPAKRRRRQLDVPYLEICNDNVGDIISFTESSVWLKCRRVCQRWQVLAERSAKSSPVCVMRAKWILIHETRRVKKTLNYRVFCDKYLKYCPKVNDLLLTMEIRDFLRKRGASQWTIDNFCNASIYWRGMFGDWICEVMTIKQGIRCRFYESHPIIIGLSIPEVPPTRFEDVYCRKGRDDPSDPTPMPKSETITILKKFFVMRLNEYYSS